MSDKTLTLQDIQDYDFTTIIWVVAPLMFFFVALEFYLSKKRKLKLYSGKDFLASLSIGVVNVLLNSVMKIAVFVVFLFFYNLSPLNLPITWWSFLLCFIALDFVRYWSHRYSS